jgi:hypothetical protein
VGVCVVERKIHPHLQEENAILNERRSELTLLRAFMRGSLSCIRPAVSINTTSVPVFLAGQVRKEMKGEKSQCQIVSSASERGVSLSQLNESVP